MPFGSEHDKRYVDVYGPAIADARLKPIRADDFYAASTVMLQVWSAIKASRTVLCDLSTRNPNVFYELGLAHVLCKPTVLIAPKIEDVPFDLRSLRFVVFDQSKPRWKKLLREKLSAAIADTLSMPLHMPLHMLIPSYLNVAREHESNIGPQKWGDLVELRAEIDELRSEVGAPNDAPRKIYSRRAAEFAWFEEVHKRYQSLAAVSADLLSKGVPKAWVRARKLLYRIPGFDEEG
jgi:hypothetical protein